MSVQSENASVDGGELRERNVPQSAMFAERAKEVVQELNVEECHSDKEFKDKKTFGRTPDGTGESVIRVSHSGPWACA